MLPPDPDSRADLVDGPEPSLLTELPIGLALFDDIDAPRCVWANDAYATFIGASSAGSITGSGLREAIPEGSYERVQLAFKTARHRAQPVLLDEVQGPVRAGDSPRWFRVEIRLTARSRAMVVIDDITEQVRARRRIEGVATLTHEALTGGALGGLVRDAVRLLTDVVAVENAAFFAPGPRGPWLVAGVGWADEHPSIVEFQGLLRVVEVIHGPTTSEDDPTLPPLLRAHAIRSGITIPVGSGDHGWLGIYTRSMRAFDATDLNAVRAVANIIAAAVVRQRADAELGYQARRLRDANEQLEAVLGAVASGIVVQAPDGRVIYGNTAAAGLTDRKSVAELLRGTSPLTDWYDLLDEEGHVIELADLPGRRALRGETAPQQLLHLRRRSGGDDRWLLIKARPLLDAGGAPRAAVIVLEDETEQKPTQLELAARTAQQALIAELGQRALTSEDLADVIQAAADGACARLGADATYVAQRTTDELTVRAAVGWRRDLVGDSVPGGPASHAGVTVRSGGPVVMGERRSERRFRREPHLVEEGVRSGLAVLVGDPRMPWGVLAVYSRARRSFTDEEIAFVQSVGNLIAAAVTRWRAEELTREHARLIEESRFDERTRIARDLHDGLAQELWLARLRFGLLLEQITEPLRATEAAQAVTEAIDRAIASARAALGAIREEPRGSMDLGEELRLVIDELGERLDLETELVIRGRLPRTQPDVESEVMAIVREAVQNVGKHAGSRSVRVVASGRKRQIRVTIIDSGRGFDAGTPQATFGLAGMRERARLIGAELDIQSAVGTGTRVDLRVPMVDGPQS